jgi:hypothetical protein
MELTNLRTPALIAAGLSIPFELRRVPQPCVIARVAVVIGLALLWSAFVADQLPCFLAVPNCD